MPTLQQKPLEKQQSIDDGILSPAGGLSLIRITPEICTRINVPFLKGVNHRLQEILIFRPCCGCWECPACAEDVARKHQFWAMHGVNVLSATGKRLDFVTVTSHEKLDHAGSLRVLPKAWGKLRDRMTYAFGKSEYFLVPEFHKKGRVHFHMVTNAILPQKWWKNNARSCGFGFMCEAEEVKSLGQVSFYVTKYLTKMLQTTNLPKHFRRVRTSQGFPKLPELPPPADWEFSLIPRETSLQEVHDQGLANGYSVCMTKGKIAWDFVG